MNDPSQELVMVNYMAMSSTTHIIHTCTVFYMCFTFLANIIGALLKQYKYNRFEKI